MASNNYRGANKRIAKNTLYLYIRMFLVLVVNLYTSRVLLHALGVSDYGTFVVVAGFVTLFGFFNATLASTIQRYFNYEGTEDNDSGIENIFSTGFRIHILIALLTIIALETIGLWYFHHYIRFPVERTEAATILFHASTLILVFNILQIPAMGLILAKEKMGIYAFINVMDVSLKLLATLSLAYLPFDSLSTYAGLLLAIAVIDFLFYTIYTKVKYPFLHFKAKTDTVLAKSMLTFTGWNLIGTFAFMLKGQGLSLLLNYFFGPVVNAARGIALQVSSAVSGFSSNISVAISPQIVTNVAEGNHLRAEKLMFTESKICFALILVLTIPLCLEIEYILRLWLGCQIPVGTGIFSILALIDILICTLNTPCTQITLATGRVKRYQVTSTIINLGLLPVSFLLLKVGFSATSAFVITIIFSCINQAACLINTHRVFRFGWTKYLIDVFLPCLAISMLLPLMPLMVKNALPPSFGRLILTTFVNIVVSIPLFYFILADKRERGICKAFLSQKLRTLHGKN